jgi:DNA-binding transcriptional ArsR family regulator
MSRRATKQVGPTRSAADDALDLVFAALSDRTRRKILARLSESPATVGDLAAPFSMTLPAVSKHIRVLERAGLLRRERDGWYHRCRFEGRALLAAGAFIDHYRSFWDQTLAGLARYVEDRPPHEKTPSARRKALRTNARSTRAR